MKNKISRAAYEIAEIISKQEGNKQIKIELTCNQVLNWYNYQINDSYKQGYFRMTQAQKNEVIRLNGLGMGNSQVANITGHAKNTVKKILLEASENLLPQRVSRMRELQGSNCEGGCL